MEMYEIVFTIDYLINAHLFQVQMPLFFLLSGFSLALGYGKKKYAGYSVCCGACQCVDRIDCRGCRQKQDCNGGEEEVFDSARYYYNRISRIVPVYWFTLIIMLPLIPLGHSGETPGSQNSIVGTILSFLGLQTWVIHFGFGPNGPSWTISTFAFFYVLFPSAIVIASRQTNLRLYQWISVCFWLQFIVCWGMLKGVGGEAAYWGATAWPFVRFPVFLMGVFAGVLCNRIQKGDKDAYGRLGLYNKSCWLWAFLVDFWSPFPFCQREVDADNLSNSQEKSFWRRRVNVNAGFYNGILILFSILNVAIFILENYKMVIMNDVFNIFRWSKFSGDWQIWFVHWQLMIIVGLCLDGGESIFAKFLNLEPLQVCGNLYSTTLVICLTFCFLCSFLEESQWQCT